MSKEAEHECRVAGSEGAADRDGLGVSRARRQASRAGRSPAATDGQNISLRARASRRNQPQETQASTQRSDGRHHPAPPRSGAAAVARTHMGAPAGAPVASGSAVRLDSAGLPFIAGALGLAVVSAAAGTWMLVIAFG